jgi:hypothetical protein
MPPAAGINVLCASTPNDWPKVAEADASVANIAMATSLG